MDELGDENLSSTILKKQLERIKEKVNYLNIYEILVLNVIIFTKMFNIDKSLTASLFYYCSNLWFTNLVLLSVVLVLKFNYRFFKDMEDYN